MKEIKEEKYNCVLSLGIACRPAYHIQKNNLRLFASPLDWMAFYNLNTVVHLFETQFVDFFTEIENKGLFTKYELGIQDVKNNIFSGHHFKHNVPIKQMQQDFRSTMLKRFQRMDEYLKNSKHIAFVCNREESAEKFLNFLDGFSKLYPNLKITTFNVIHKEIENIEFEEFKFSNKNRLIEVRFKDTNKDGPDAEKNPNFWHGNDECWEQLLKHFKIEKIDFVEKNKNAHEK